MTIGPRIPVVSTARRACMLRGGRRPSRRNGEPIARSERLMLHFATDADAGITMISVLDGLLVH